jgi:hypothetical protein
MEKPETRLLEEWKANNDLFKFHEDLKQKRFAYFLTIQTAFLAIFGLFAKETLADANLLRLFGLVFISTPPLFIAFYFIHVDAHARAYVDTIKAKLLIIEEEWRQLFPNNHFSTYEQQFAVLVHRKREAIDKCLAVRGIRTDPFEDLVHTKAAHVGEETILRLFRLLWGILLTSAIIALCWHLVTSFLCKS